MSEENVVEIDQFEPPSSVVPHPMNKLMGVSMIFDNTGAAILYYDKPLQDVVRYAEYDQALEKLSLVYWSGALHDSGMKIKAEMGARLKKAERILIVRVENDKETDKGIVPLIFREDYLLN